MSTHIRDILNDEGASVSFDTRLANSLEDYYTKFITRNGEYAEFFGGHLTGAHRITFMDSDERKWWDLLGMDKSAIYDRFAEAMHAYTLRSPPEIPPVLLDWKISTDPMNQASTWLMYRFCIEKNLSDKYRVKGMLYAYLIMQVRMLTSKIRVHWHNPCPRDVAEAVYTAMSNQYLIKRRKSWGALLEYRGTTSVTTVDGEKPNFFDVIERMDDDTRVVKFLNDCKSFISGIIENIYGFHKKVVHDGAYNIITLGSIVDKGGEGGGTKLRDRVSATEMYTHYLLGILGDKDSFIKKALMDIILPQVRRCRPALLETTLKHISDNWMSTSVVETVKLLLLHGYEYMSDSKGAIDRRLTVAATLARLKGVYNASKANDELIDLRERFNKLVTESTHIANPADKAAVRTATMLYIMARALIKDTMT